MKKAIFVPVVLGILFGGGIFYWNYQANQPPSMEEIVAEGRAAGAERLELDEDEYGRLIRMMDKIRGEDGSISQEDWDFLSGYLDSSNAEIRNLAILPLSRLSPDSPRRAEAIQVARSNISATPTENEFGALLVLWRFQEPDWRAFATRMAEGDDPQAASLARRVLERGEQE